MPNYKYTCKYCGKKKLAWFRVNGSWKLLEDGGHWHRCLKSKPVEKKGLSAFLEKTA